MDDATDGTTSPQADDQPAEEVLTPDSALFRQTLGHFATGVTIVTAFDGEPLGIVANSFTSVSLDPPLVLFCVAHSSTSWPRIAAAGVFAVNVLGEDDQDLSQLFVKKDQARFDARPWSPGVSGAPVFDSAIAYIDCRIEATHRAGDHDIVIGRVLDVDVREDGRPLLFFQGRYGRLHAEG